MQERLRKAFIPFLGQFCRVMVVVSIPFTAAWPAQDCRPLLIPPTLPTTLTDRPGALSVVSFDMHPGPLRPQLENLMQQHLQVQSVVWLAATEHQWPSRYQLQADNWESILERLLEPYQLRVQLHANHTAVVDYLPQQRRAW